MLRACQLLQALLQANASTQETQAGSWSENYHYVLRTRCLYSVLQSGGEWKFLESRSFSTTASIITFQDPEPKTTS